MQTEQLLIKNLSNRTLPQIFLIVSISFRFIEEMFC